MTKQQIYEACKQEVNLRLSHTQTAIDSARESANSEQKSTAGDKHDTARAMAQFEQEKLSNQLSEQLKLKELLSRIDPTTTLNEVRMGALVHCTNGIFYIGVGIGKIEISSSSVFCVSVVSPIGQGLLGKKPGDTYEVNGRSFSINQIE